MSWNTRRPAGETRSTIAEHAAVPAAIEEHSPAAAMRAHLDAAGDRLPRSPRDDPDQSGGGANG
ncbi:GntR family transcriptional regulator [Streptosporangium soli]|nr:hypothetical protein [Streptosporangium sp. KLBMP 9127]